MNKDLQIAKKTVQTEIQALKKLSASFNRSSQFSKAVNLLYKMRGKCLVIGVGKSHLVGLKVSATLSSNSDFVSVLQNSSNYGSIGANNTSNGQLYSILIEDNVTDRQDLELRLNITSSDGTNVDCHIPINVFGGLLVPESSSVNVNNEIISISIVNDGSITVNNIEFELFSNSDMININSPSQ